MCSLGSWTFVMGHNSVAFAVVGLSEPDWAIAPRTKEHLSSQQTSLAHTVSCVCDKVDESSHRQR